MDAKHLLTVLSRLAARCPEETPRLTQILEERLERLGGLAIEVAQETEGPLGTALALAIERRASPELARTLSTKIPRTTVSLLDAAVAAERRAQEAFDRDGRAGAGYERALRLIQFSDRLACQGRLEEATATAMEAVSQARSVFGGERLLADCLRHLASLQKKGGNYPKALGTISEAEELLPVLLKTDPDAHRLTHVNILLVREAILTEFGQLDEALSVSERVLALMGTASATGSVDDRYSYAGAIFNLGAGLIRVDRHQEAIPLVRRSVEMQRDLHDQHPDRFAQSFINALNALGGLLVAEGELSEATQILQEAEQLLRRLASERPEAFAVDLASLLIHKAQLLIQTTNVEKAHATLAEAAPILRTLATAQPTQYAQRLADVYRLSGGLHQAERRADLAIAAYEKALLLRTHTFLSIPASSLQEMWQLLNCYWECYQEIGGQTSPPRLLLVLADCANRIQENINQHSKQSGPLLIKLDAPGMRLIFEEQRGASERFADEPAIRQAAASSGFNAIEYLLHENELDAARTVLSEFGTYQSKHPDDAYLLDEYATALRNFSMSAREHDQEAIALDILRHLERLVSAYSSSTHVREQFAHAAFPLTFRTGAEGHRIFANLQALTESFPGHEELRLCTGRAAVNLIQVETGTRELAAQTQTWLEALEQRYPSSTLRALLGMLSVNHLKWLAHRDLVDEANKLYQRLRLFAARFCDEEPVLDSAAQAHRVIVETCVRLARVDDARACFDEFCTYMQVSRACRLSRALALQSLAFGYSVADQEVDAAWCIKNLLHTVEIERGDAEFVAIAQQLKKVANFGADIAGASKDVPKRPNRPTLRSRLGSLLVDFRSRSSGKWP